MPTTLYRVRYRLPSNDKEFIYEGTLFDCTNFVRGLKSHVPSVTFSFYRVTLTEIPCSFET